MVEFRIIERAKVFALPCRWVIVKKDHWHSPVVLGTHFPWIGLRGNALPPVEAANEPRA